MEKVLDALQMRAELTVDLLNSLLLDRREFHRDTRRFYRHGPREFKTDWAQWYRKRQAFYSLINKLKGDGLITKKSRKRHTPWFITKRGLKKLKQYRETQRHRNGMPIPSYEKERSPGLVIVAFDIPERERKKRAWIREVLAGLGLTLLQKSVWIGTRQIPQEFISDLKVYELLPYVHIFSINRKGTIDKVA